MPAAIVEETNPVDKTVHDPKLVDTTKPVNMSTENPRIISNPGNAKDLDMSAKDRRTRGLACKCKSKFTTEV